MLSSINGETRNARTFEPPIVRQTQGRREGVKDVTVSQNPDPERGPGNLENKRKIGFSKEILPGGPKKVSIFDPYYNGIRSTRYMFWAPNLQAYRAPKLSGPRLVYSVCKKVNL
jgi:hypothetical protein